MAADDKAKKKNAYRTKIIMVGMFFVFFFFAVVLRAYQLQILGNEKLNNLASSQYTTKLTDSPRRGAIYDRNGDILAMDILVASVGIHPKKIADKPTLKKLLMKYVSISEAEVDKKLASTRSFEWIQRRIPNESGQAIDAADIPGVQVVSEYRRYYPNMELAGQLLGAVGYDAVALGGIELTYDNYLKFDSTERNAEKDARGKFFSPVGKDGESQHDVHLTIDRNIQFITEEALKENGIKHNAKAGFAIVMDIESGEILAMANYPEFNPNVYWKYPQANWKNHAIVDVFEPGSTFKTISMGAALATGQVKESDKFFCENGSFRIRNNVINDSHKHGWLTASEILKVSSNIGITKITQKIGKKQFYDFIQNVGIDRKPILGLVGETMGSVRSYQNWQDIDFSNISFGQGISVNGVQMMTAYGALVNEGHFQKPILVKKIIGNGGVVLKQNQNRKEHNVMDEKNSRTLVDMLFGVTQPGGTAGVANITGYLAGGKTGTAQKYDPKLRTYAEHEFVSSFIGFSPLNHPKVLVYVVYDTPRQNGYYGGVVAAPVFKIVAEKSLRYFGIAPSEPLNSKEELVTKKTDKAKEKINAVSKNISVLALENTIQKNQTDEFSQSMSNNVVPNFTGLPLRKVLQLVQKSNMDVSVQGSGVVVKQTPLAGTKVDSKLKMHLVLASRN